MVMETHRRWEAFEMRFGYPVDCRLWQEQTENEFSVAPLITLQRLVLGPRETHPFAAKQACLQTQLATAWY